MNKPEKNFEKPEKKPGLFGQLFGKDEQKKKKSCCCCGGFEIEEIEGPESKNEEVSLETTQNNINKQ